MAASGLAELTAVVALYHGHGTHPAIAEAVAVAVGQLACKSIGELPASMMQQTGGMHSLLCSILSNWAETDGDVAFAVLQAFGRMCSTAMFPPIDDPSTASGDCKPKVPARVLYTEANALALALLADGSALALLARTFDCWAPDRRADLSLAWTQLISLLARSGGDNPMQWQTLFASGLATRLLLLLPCRSLAESALDALRFMSQKRAAAELLLREGAFEALVHLLQAAEPASADPESSADRLRVLGLCLRTLWNLAVMPAALMHASKCNALSVVLALVRVLLNQAKHRGEHLVQAQASAEASSAADVVRAAMGLARNLTARTGTEQFDLQLAAHGVDVVCEAMRAHEHSASIQRLCCGVLRNVCIRRQARSSLRRADGIALVLAVLKAHANDEQACEAALGALRNATVDETASKDQLRWAGGIGLILASVTRHMRCASLARHGLATLYNLVHTHDANLAALHHAGGLAVVLSCVRSHADASELTSSALAIARVAVSSATESMRGAFVDLGLVDLALAAAARLPVLLVEVLNLLQALCLRSPVGRGAVLERGALGFACDLLLSDCVSLLGADARAASDESAWREAQALAGLLRGACEFCPANCEAFCRHANGAAFAAGFDLARRCRDWANLTAPTTAPAPGDAALAASAATALDVLDKLCALAYSLACNAPAWRATLLRQRLDSLLPHAVPERLTRLSGKLRRLMTVRLDEHLLLGLSAWVAAAPPTHPAWIGGGLAGRVIGLRVGRWALVVKLFSALPALSAAQQSAVLVVLHESVAGALAGQPATREALVLATGMLPRQGWPFAVFERAEHGSLAAVLGAGAGRPRAGLYLADEPVVDAAATRVATGEEASAATAPLDDEAEPPPAPLSWQARLRVLMSACEALTHLHAAGRLHRNLSPTNVLVDGNGFALLADAVSVRLIEAMLAAAAPQPGAPATFESYAHAHGASDWLDPDLFAVDSQARPSPRHDVYSMGLVLVATITAQLRDARAVFATGEALAPDELAGRLGDPACPWPPAVFGRLWALARSALAAGDARCSIAQLAGALGAAAESPT